MPPTRTYTDWNKEPSYNEDKIEPYRKYFFICEGKNTEVWYFKKLIDLRKKLGIHPLIDIRLMEKIDSDENLSNPKALIEFAEKQKNDPNNKFDKEHDKMIIVFDADIYKNKPEVYEKIVKTGKETNIIAVTNPSFELFLLLHYENSYEEIIVPNIDELIKNSKVSKKSKKRYISKVFSSKSGMNAKENSAIGELAINVDIAINQEKKLNQDVDNAIGNLTSNIGKIIEDIRNDEVIV